MQTKIIALAVAGLVSGAAFAQTNVTLYGVADAAYVYGKIGNNKFSGIENGQLSGNRLGVKGEENLGNGLKAIFTYEWAITIDKDTAPSAPRQSFVGLTGGFGTFSLGRQYSPSGNGYLAATDPWGYGSISPLGQVLAAGITETSIVGTLGTGAPSRWNNSVAYQSPNFSGFDFRVIYSFGEKVRDSFGDASKDASKFGIGGSYKNGPLYLTLIYEQQFDSADNVDDGIKSWAVGGTYDFKVAKLYANYMQAKYDPDTLGITDKIKNKLWSIGVGVPVGKAGTVKAQYAQFKSDLADDMKAKIFGIGYEYNLSKRTTIYTVATKFKNEDYLAMGQPKAVDATATGIYTPALMGENGTTFGLGIKHTF